MKKDLQEIEGGKRQLSLITEIISRVKIGTLGQTYGVVRTPLAPNPP